MVPSTHEVIKVLGCNPSHDLSLAAATHLSAAIDTLGFREALFIAYAGTHSATGDSTITVTECDTSGGTYAPITGAAFVNITASNDVGEPFVGRMSLDGRKRYLKVSNVVADDVVEIAILCVLAAPVVAPTTLAQTLAFNLDPA